jgi:hypothetical protein
MATGLDHIRDRQRFIRELTETITWCMDSGSLSQPRTSLRTCKVKLDDLNSQHHQVFRVSLERSGRLRSAGKRELSPVTDLCGGRLLAYFPNDNLADGVAEVESQGFFDVDNIPPYDTWVWMVRNVRAFERADRTKGEIEANYLVAWVPPDFLQLAGAGVDTNPEQCILWLDALDDEFVRSLRSLNLMQDTFSKLA